MATQEVQGHTHQSRNLVRFSVESEFDRDFLLVRIVPDCCIWWLWNVAVVECRIRAADAYIAGCVVEMLDTRCSNSTASAADGSSAAADGSSTVVASSATAGSSAAVASSTAVTGSSAAAPFSPYSDTCLQCCVMLTGFHYNELCGIPLLV